MSREERIKVEAREIIGEPSLPARPSFGLEPVARIDGVEELAACPGADATPRDCHRQMRLAGAGPADQGDIPLLSDEAAADEIARRREAIPRREMPRSGIRSRSRGRQPHAGKS